MSAPLTYLMRETCNGLDVGVVVKVKAEVVLLGIYRYDLTTLRLYNQKLHRLSDRGNDTTIKQGYSKNLCINEKEDFDFKSNF